MLYADNNSFCGLGNTTELNDLFCYFSNERYLRRNFLLTLQAVLFQLQFYQRWTSLTVFFKFLTKSVDQSLLDGYVYLLLSLKLFSPHLTTLLPGLDQSNEIHFATSWWALVIKGRSNTLFKCHLVKCHFDFNCLPPTGLLADKL